MDPTTLTDAQLSQLARDVSAEQQRRATLSGIPLQIAELAAQYRSGGGDSDVLLDAITTDPPTTPQESTP